MAESRRATRPYDTVGAIVVHFSNAISNRPGMTRTRVRDDIDSARRLVAHYQPYNNTRIDADVIVRIADGTTYLTPVDLRVDGAYRFCPCGGDETNCVRATA